MARQTGKHFLAVSVSIEYPVPYRQTWGIEYRAPRFTVNSVERSRSRASDRFFTARLLDQTARKDAINKTKSNIHVFGGLL